MRNVDFTGSLPKQDDKYKCSRFIATKVKIEFQTQTPESSTLNKIKIKKAKGLITDM